MMSQINSRVNIGYNTDWKFSGAFYTIIWWKKSSLIEAFSVGYDFMTVAKWCIFKGKEGAEGHAPCV